MIYLIDILFHTDNKMKSPGLDIPAHLQYREHTSTPLSENVSYLT